MGSFTDILNNWGYWGMLVGAFLAGSFIPFSSETLLVALIAAGLRPWELLIYASVGNVGGSMLNYGIGRLGKIEWTIKYLHVRQKDLDKAQKFMSGHGAWIGFFAFLPIIGSAITILLGYMRSNLLISVTSITIGKVLRYVLVIYGVAIVFPFSG
ncbi:MAG: DedA family protein [Prevotella sp.]|jgi:membrane protein YqaA with SNARE-associated domain|nr:MULTISPECIES: YqaA family protein [unclassified Prevotella]MCH3970234.1 DedA family protein [Prevotella sp.]MCH3986102.1 DedA family protein [Prevotella sp.]MCH3992410.1 DedA family protein [Prevotella sp.]MCH4016986.1 DedA family protein [Prevotella sp.]MCH4100092.1 DedA family protein [Prevotella sp.]